MIENTVLYEGLIYTHDVYSSVELLNRYVSDKNMSFKSSPDELGIDFVIKGGKEFNEINFDKALKTINNLGWYPCSYKLTFFGSLPTIKYDRNKFIEKIKNTTDTMVIFLDAKYDKQILISKLPQNAYHITPKEYLEKINKIGLVPKNKEKFGKQPSRIYLAFNNEGIDILLEHSRFYPGKIEFAIFVIDIKNFSRDKRAKFFIDPRFEGYGFYTYDNIPPQYVKLLSIKKR